MAGLERLRRNRYAANTIALYMAAPNKVARMRLPSRIQLRSAYAAARFTRGKLMNTDVTENKGATPAAKRHADESPRIEIRLASRIEASGGEQEEGRHRELDGVLVNEHTVAGEERVERCHRRREHGKTVVAGQLSYDERHERNARDAADERQKLE